MDRIGRMVHVYTCLRAGIKGIIRVDIQTVFDFNNSRLTEVMHQIGWFSIFILSF